MSAQAGGTMASRLMASRPKPDSTVLELAVNHVILPPKLPGNRDPNPLAVETFILDHLIEACQEVVRFLPATSGYSDMFHALSCLVDALQQTRSVHGEHLEQGRLLASIQAVGGGSHGLVLFVREQNAGIILRHSQNSTAPDDNIVFEAFEILSPSAAALSADALERSFPDTAASMSIQAFSEPEFQQALSSFLDQASSEQFELFAAKVQKANSTIVEKREPADPALITQTLMPLIESLGRHERVTSLRKAVRDDVVWHDAEIPWRRSPFWLLIRVAAQRLLSDLLGGPRGRIAYKFVTAVVAARLLDASRGTLSPDLGMLVMRKLCRRMAKLETDRQQDNGANQPTYNLLFEAMKPRLLQSVTAVKESLQNLWKHDREKRLRKVHPLPTQAKESDMELTLRHSGPYIHAILSAGSSRGSIRPTPAIPPDQDSTKPPHLVKVMQSLSIIEEHTWQTDSFVELSHSNAENVVKLGNRLERYIDDAMEQYKGHPDFLSVCILTALDFWVTMDSLAVDICPTLAAFNPVFKPASLDFLQLQTAMQLNRLRMIQTYLQNRWDKCGASAMSIFEDPKPGCFAQKYLQEDRDRKGLVVLWTNISMASAGARRRKEAEFTLLNDEYSTHTRGIQENVCTCSVNRDGSRNVRGCKRCWHWRTRKKMKIDVHEDYLPTPGVDVKDWRTAAIVFELGKPAWLSRYRDAMWHLLKALACPASPDKWSPLLELCNFDLLDKYNSTADSTIGLASLKKSFTQSHYARVSFPTTVRSVAVPFGPVFTYFSKDLQCSPSVLAAAPTFNHLCGLTIPKGMAIPPLNLDGAEWPREENPSSYQIVARQSKCPSHMSVHEYTALQSIISSTQRRWPTILRELGASNLNFSSEDTALVLTQLATQAGPQDESGTHRRLMGWAFADLSFCRRLYEQIKRRLGAIASSWREFRYMDTLITLALRLVELGPSSLRQHHISLLRKAREITMEWIRRLRNEVFDSQDAASTLNLAEFAMSAAMLCRRTFLVDQQERFETEMEADDLCVYVQASIALQEHFMAPLGDLSPFQRYMLMRDSVLAYKLRGAVLVAKDRHPEAFERAIAWGWADSSPEGRQFSPWRLCSDHSGWNKHWMEAHTTATSTTVSQAVHYNIVDGRLLVDGKALGQLPVEFTKSDTVKNLFGPRHLRVMSSPLPGMAYQLHVLMENEWQVHFGFRNDDVFVRAVNRRSTFEYIPGSRFKGPDRPDLPHVLVDSCAHWLNLCSRELECRRRPSIWRRRSGDWIINTRFMRAIRRRGEPKQATLIDLSSPLFDRIASIFDGFIDTAHLTIFENRNGLHVEIKHLTLSFHVNRSGTLQCKELNSFVDRDQDAGTFYGLKSMIVLRDVKNRTKRSLIVPLGNVRFRPEGISTAVLVENDGTYGHFGIDPVVGRLNCATEPRLLYTKALYHAYTSSILPDPLTGRTGVEEALHFLQSPICQPWGILPAGSVPVLENIARLSPDRSFYPETLEIMEQVKWNPSLPWWAQHDSYLPAVQHIFDKGTDLARFSRANAPPCTKQVASLRKRAQLRRSRFEATGFSTTPLSHPESRRVYTSRFFNADSGRQNVRWVLHTLNSEPFRIKPMRQLRSHLEEWKWMCPVAADGRASTTITSLLHAEVHDQWWTYVTLCASMERVHASFFLAVLAHKLDVDLLMMLAAFSRMEERHDSAALLPEVALLVPFKSDDQPVRAVLEALARNAAHNIGDSAFSRQRNNRISWADKSKYEELCDADAKMLVSELFKQWPCARLRTPDFQSDTLRVADAVATMEGEWGRAHQNHLLGIHVGVIDQQLSLYRGVPPAAVALVEMHTNFFSPARDPTHDVLTLPLLARNPGRRATVPASGANPMANIPSHQTRMQTSPDRQSAVYKLQVVLGGLLQSGDELRKQYAHDLQESLQALQKEKAPPRISRMPTPSEANDNVASGWERRGDILRHLHLLLLGNDPRAPWLNTGGLWPSMSPVSLLEQLRSIGIVQFGTGMRDAFIDLGLAMAELQRLRRIYDAVARRDEAKLQEEQRNLGHSNWSPQEWPDWLLLEIDSNILIRPDQVDVALATTRPPSGDNSVLQMNMGRGKTSCIMPMAVAALADGSQLCRLIIPKALLVQTAQTIQAKIGYLVGRELSHVPFSRQTKPTLEDLDVYRSIHSRILKDCGVMLTLPEHVLSFKLSGIQALSDKKDTAKDMIKHQDWLTATCRDILDESDFTLAVKTQLIYPSGAEIAVDGHPHRWLTIEVLLGLAESHARSLKSQFSQSIQVVERAGGFPLLFFLRPDVEDALMERIVDDVVNGKTAIFRASAVGKPVDSAALKRVVYDKCISVHQCQKACSSLQNPAVAVKQIMLIRGLVQQRVLVMCLKKRWNVQYGLHPDRIPIAVPYEAKGIPSEQAEFGHPDVAIVLTCLSFYYSGVTVAQLRSSLQRILNSGDPATEYDQWISGSDGLREELRHWNLINTIDEGQIRELWSCLHTTKNVLDHFLNAFVFPLHAKQFSVKLQASGWDIPLFSTKQRRGGIKGGLTTGFSGTNDNRYLLPMTIRQHDLPALQQTNAEVLTYLLETRNAGYMIARDKDGKRLDETGLLEMLHNEKIRILIDAGASVLEMDNRKLVETWLSIDNEAQAAVYFNADRAMVKYKQGKDVPLIATPFAENFEGCLVYLDEVHTRGTDLKLPPKAKGAVTLGLGQTKDHTVQAAMRLRQLGTTQSIVFMAPPEVDQSIRMLCNKSPQDKVCSADVIAWLLEQTCRQNEQMRPLYYAQGMDYCRRNNAVHQYPNRLGSVPEAQSYISSVFTPEHQAIEDLYCSAPQTAQSSNNHPTFNTSILTGFATELKRQRCALRPDDMTQMYSSALEEIEQEREVEFQVEEVRETQKPPTYKPYKFPGLHSNIRRFALEGVLDSDNAEGYVETFEAIGKTQLGQKFGVCKGSSRVFASTEWLRTVHTKSGLNEGMMRPVEWVLLNPSTSTALVIIPEEADETLALIRRQKNPQQPTHLVVYSVPVTKHMSSFNKLQYYAHPPLPKQYTPPVSLVADLGIIAGRLYFGFSEYEYLLKHFKDTSLLGKNSLVFLAEWLVMCRKGQDIMHTPAGYICQGRPLHEGHAFFIDGHENGAPGSPGGTSGSPKGSGSPGGIHTSGEASDDDDDDDDDAWITLQEEDDIGDEVEKKGEGALAGRVRTGSETTAYEDASSGSSDLAIFK